MVATSGGPSPASLKGPQRKNHDRPDCQRSRPPTSPAGVTSPLRHVTPAERSSERNVAAIRLGQGVLPNHSAASRVTTVVSGDRGNSTGSWDEVNGLPKNHEILAKVLCGSRRPLPILRALSSSRGMGSIVRSFLRSRTLAVNPVAGARRLDSRERRMRALRVYGETVTGAPTKERPSRGSEGYTNRGNHRRNGLISGIGRLGVKSSFRWNQELQTGKMPSRRQGFRSTQMSTG